MMRKSLTFHCAFAISMYLGAASMGAQTNSNGIIAADDGGAPGYQHSIERSRFSTGGGIDQSKQSVEEFGFSKIVGVNGVFATNLRTGLVIALQNSGTNKDQADNAATLAEKPRLIEPDEHNKLVTDYFVSAGVPRDQIGGVHANTFLSAHGTKENPQLSPPAVDGYASIIERRVEERFSVPESVAWARLDGAGRVITEWVFWPAIPAKALSDARRIAELTSGNQKIEYLRRLPDGLNDGQVVIHHTLATDEGPFEVVATFDVLETRQASKQVTTGKAEAMELSTTIVRHFDVNGKERRLSYERIDSGASDEKGE